MNKYVNVPCAKCGQAFTAEDDVVVCPDCGAPHHRHCYAQLGHCALQEENHAQGKLWEGPTRTPEQLAEKSCPRCGAINLGDAQYCSTCGIPLDGSYHPPGSSPEQAGAGSTNTGYGGGAGGYDNLGAQPAQQPIPIMSPMGPIHYDDDFDGVTAQEIAVYVGPNYRRYLTVFKMMRESGRSFSFNWSAFFLSFSFLFYRKLYRPAIVVLTAMAILCVPRVLYANESMKFMLAEYAHLPIAYDLGLIGNLGSIVDIINLVQLALMLFLATFSDKLYYAHIITEIKKLRAAAPATLPREQWLSMLSLNGGTNPRLGYLSALLTAAVVFGISYLMTYQMVAGLM